MYIRPILEYCVETWSPTQKLIINKLEKVQKFFTRTVLRKCNMDYINYETRLRLFNLKTLENRRTALQLTTLHKLVHRKFDFEPSLILEFTHRESRKHNLQIRIKHKNRKSANSFTNRICNKWNTLHKDLVKIWDDKQFCNSLLAIN